MPVDQPQRSSFASSRFSTREMDLGSDLNAQVARTVELGHAQQHATVRFWWCTSHICADDDASAPALQYLESEAQVWECWNPY